MKIYESLLKGETSLAVAGLGYVGMPLAALFSRKVKVIGFDTNPDKIAAYKAGVDYTKEIGDKALKEASVFFTDNESFLKSASFVIAAVPTPVNEDNLPDLSYLESVCEIIGRNLSKDAIVVFESTVYCGVTEDICVPIIEKASGLKCGRDFKIGYSPERINPGDKVHRLDNIVKIVSGMDRETTDEIAKVYDLIVTAGTFKAKSIRVAELAKLEENAQRDINIAFMNELSMIHEKLGVDTADVLDAMNTKWNALGFYPGLVGGHCISVDPYYLIYKAEKEEYYSALASSGRKINNDMAAHVADAAVKQLIKANVLIKSAKVYIFGVTFKENCPDMRNSLVLKIIKQLNKYEIYPLVTDPDADENELRKEYGIELTPLAEVKNADCIIFAVKHDKFSELGIENIHKFFSDNNEHKNVLLDIKNIFSRDIAEKHDYIYWCL